MHTTIAERKVAKEVLNNANLAKKLHFSDAWTPVTLLAIMLSRNILLMIKKNVISLVIGSDSRT